MQRSGVVPWPRSAVEEYRSAGYWSGRPLGSHMWEWADRYGDRPALVDGDVRLSHRRLAENVDALAEHLLSTGLGPGRTVLLQMPNRWEFVVTVLACVRIGTAPVLALPAHRERELGHTAALAEVDAIVVPRRVRDCDHEALAHRVADGLTDRPSVLVVGPAEHPESFGLDLEPSEAGRQAGEARRRRLDALGVDPLDVAFFLMSGGTTGLPKLIARTHDDYEYNARGSARLCGFDEETTYLCALPAAHGFALGCPGLLGALCAGGRVVMSPSPNPDTAFALIARERVTVTAVVPAVAQRWLASARESGQDLSSLRLLQVGGARLAPELARRVGPDLGCALQQVFGMAEGLLNFTRPDDPAHVVETTQGRPMSPADEIRIVDPSGSPVPRGDSGELLARGPYTPRGYFRGGAHNRRSFTPDGWYRTGDVVSLDPGGNLVVEGRIKDLVNRGGEKISAEEVEDVAHALPGVAEAAVVAVPDPEVGERICLCVVPAGESAPTLADVEKAFVEQAVARYKFPERLEILPSLPCTAIGKIDKESLRKQIQNN